MSIALYSGISNVTSTSTPLTLVAAGNYVIQDISIKVPAFITPATGFYEYGLSLTSGGNTFHTSFFLGTSTVTTWQSVNYSFDRSFGSPLDPLILTPNSSIVLTVTAISNVSNLRCLINISGFKK